MKSYQFGQEFSLIDIFGSLPVHPIKFKTLPPELRLLGKAKEGNDFCTTCGTITASNPRSHHKECFGYKDEDNYSAHINPLGYCPNCGSDDGLGIDSNIDMQISIISCCDCLFEYSGKMPEEELQARFINQRGSGQ